MHSFFFRICVSSTLSSCVHNKTRMLPQDIHLANIVVVRFLKHTHHQEICINSNNHTLRI